LVAPFSLALHDPGLIGWRMHVQSSDDGTCINLGSSLLMMIIEALPTQPPFSSTRKSCHKLSYHAEE
jgi:hypothetical protein